MPQRTYSGIDLINYLTNFTPGAGPNPATPSTPSQGNASMFVSANAVPGSVTCTSTLNVSGDFDFDAFPAIPNNALISEIDFSWDANITMAASANDPSCNVAGNCLVTLGVTDLTDSQIGGGDGPGLVSASLSQSTAYNLHTIIPLNITKAQLETDYGSIFFGFIMVLEASGSANASITGTIGMDNFNLTITYEEGPATGMTITPASGNVEPSQILVVTVDPSNPNAANLKDLTYAAITEDGHVIPIIPQLIYMEPDAYELLTNNPDSEPQYQRIYTVWLEVPSPSYGPCLDCIEDCPECTQAFAPCDEDLTGEACQAAMQACLDCLIDCLEDIELGEDCQQTSGTPPDSPTPVIIVAGGGTQFSGSVTLGSFVILVANGSGLYQFTPGLTHDILYRAARDGTTYNVKIPNPGGKTGFFRS